MSDDVVRMAPDQSESKAAGAAASSSNNGDSAAAVQNNNKKRPPPSPPPSADCECDRVAAGDEEQPITLQQQQSPAESVTTNDATTDSAAASAKKQKQQQQQQQQQEEEAACNTKNKGSTIDNKTKSHKNNNKPKQKKRKHVDPAVLALRKTIQQCCRTDDLATAMEAYRAAVEARTPVESALFDCLLNLCDGLQNSNSTTNSNIHAGTPKPRNSSNNKRKDDNNDDKSKMGLEAATEGATPTTPAAVRAVDDETRLNYAAQLHRHMVQQLQLPLSETACTTLVRLHARTGHLEQAERWLRQAEAESRSGRRRFPKLRLYAPLLTVHCEAQPNRNLLAAVRVWHRLSTNFQLTLTEKEYGSLLECCAAVNNDGVSDDDAAAAAAAMVVERVLTDLSEDVPVPAQSTARAIRAWFETKGCACATTAATATAAAAATPTAATSDTIAKLLGEITPPYRPETPTMGPVVHEHGWIVSPACAVDANGSGTLQSGCLQGEALQPVELSQEAWREMMQMNERIAVTGKLSEDDALTVQGGGKGPKRPVDDRAARERQRHWTAFDQFLRQKQRQRQTVDVVIDGANVGFFDTNFAGAPPHVDYRQIDWVVQQFAQEKKQTVLLVMHSRHFQRQQMPAWAEPLVRQWLDAGVLYRTPPNMNDDWFWLHAALFFGPGTLLLTNDEMRDHHFQMVAPRSFLRWRDRHQIHFEFGPWRTNNRSNSNRRREVVLTYPRRYTRCIQKIRDVGLVIPLPKRGDENRFLDGAFVAEEEEVPVEETYMCIRKNTGTSDAAT